ncbi:MAG: hypothetical protein VW987_06200, partial [Alphaproteobacteria bacterium]
VPTNTSAIAGAISHVFIEVPPDNVTLTLFRRGADHAIAIGFRRLWDPGPVLPPVLVVEV